MKVLFFAVLSALVVNGQPDVNRWMELNSAGIRLVHAGDFAAAEMKFRAALIEGEKFPENDFRYLANLSNLALTREEQGDLPAAEKNYRRVLELREKYLPPEAVEIASTLNNLATVLHSAARDTEADPLLRRGLLIAENAHDDRVTAAILNTLGLVLIGQGEPARAEPVLRRALALFQKTGGAESLDAGKTANNLAALYSGEGELAKAEEMQRVAIPIYQKHLPAGHPLIGAVMNNMFTILGAQKRFDEGEPYLRTAVEIAERSEPHSLRTQQIRSNLATLEASRGNWQAAADTIRKVIAEEERLLGENDRMVATSLTNYSEALKHLNQKSEAKEAERRANAIMKAFRP